MCRCIRASAIVSLGLAVIFVRLFADVAACEGAAPKKVAVLVGVNHYEKRGLRDLEFAERDVEELAAILKSSGFEVSVLTTAFTDDRRANLANIRAHFDRALQGRTKDDLVLIGLAGHGFQIEVDDASGVRSADSFFCPTDALVGDPSTMLSISRLLEDLDRRGGGHNLLLIDACREDPTRGRGLDGSTVKTLPAGVAVLFGCDAGQKTYESENAGGGHGVFFHFVIEGLRGAAKNDVGEITWSRLTEYVSENVELQTPELLKNERLQQTPFEVKNIRGRSPILARIDVTVKTPSSRPSNSTPSSSPEPAISRIDDDPFAEAVATANRIENKTVQAMALVSIAEFQRNLPDASGAKITLASAVAAARQATLGKFSAWPLQTVAEAQAAMGDVNAAKLTFAEALAAARNTYSGYDSTYGYNTVIKLLDLAEARSKADDRLGADETFRNAVWLAEVGNTAALVAVAQRQAKVGDKAGAAKTLNNAKTRARQKTSGVGGDLCWIAATEVEAGYEAAGVTTYEEARRHGLYNNAWDVFFAARAVHSARQGDVAAAVQATKSLSAGVDEIALNRISGVQVDAQDFDGALATANLIIDSGQRSTAIGRVVTALVQKGDIAAANTRVSEVIDPRVREECLAAIGAKQIESGELQGALESVRAMSPAVARTTLTAKIAAGLARQGDAQAETLFNELLATPVSADPPALAGALAEVGRMEQAFKIARTLQVDDVRVKALLAIAAAKHKLEKDANAKEAKKEAAKGPAAVPSATAPANE